MPGPVVSALIAHVDSSFLGPNGDYPAVLEAIAGLTAQQAAWKPSPDSNSIWQMVEHLAAAKEWQLDMLERGQAEPRAWVHPPDDDIALEASWQALLARLQAAQVRLKSALEQLDDDQLLAQPVAELNRTLLELILSSGSAHEAHHGGQISYLRGIQGV